MEGISAFIVGLVFGIGAGAFIAWEVFVRSERPRLHVTPEFVATMNEAVVLAWLDARGLMWQPKGIDFKADLKGDAHGRR